MKVVIGDIIGIRQGTFLIDHNDLITTGNACHGHGFNGIVEDCCLGTVCLPVDYSGQENDNFFTVAINFIEDEFYVIRAGTQIICADMQQNNVCGIINQPGIDIFSYLPVAPEGMPFMIRIE